MRRVFAVCFYVLAGFFVYGTCVLAFIDHAVKWWIVVPHRHTVFTIPKRLRVFFKYDRKLNTILFRAAWGALSQALGIDERELAAIFTVQTAGEALNYHPHLHGLLADGYWKDGVFTRLLEVDLKAIEEAFAERVLAQLHRRELIADDDVAQILSQDHTGFGVWLGAPFHDK